MSMIYDNWERLVAAVLKREENWEMAHAPSRSISNISSIASDFDPNSSFRLDENFKSEVQESATQIDQHEWIEQYEPGVYITVVAFIDGTKDIKRARFSRRRFKKEEAETWWLENREKVYKKYNVSFRQAQQLGKSSISSQAGLASKVPLLGKSEESRSSKDPEDKWIEQYEPGVYVTLGAFNDGSRHIIRVRFSRRKFEEHQAEAWWLRNRENVYKKYNVKLQ